LRRAFGERAEIFITRKASEPAYYFGSPWLYRIIKSVNKFSPEVFLPVLDVYIRKR
jgi:hypothetical protein